MQINEYIFTSCLKNKIVRMLSLLVVMITISFLPTQTLIAEESNAIPFSGASSAAIDDWSGAYLAAIIGFANGEHPNNGLNLNSDLFGFSKLSLNDNYSDDLSVNGGFALGFQQQFDSFIIGFEGDWTYSSLEFSKNNPDVMLSNNDGTSFDISGSAINAGGSNFQTKAKLDWIGTIRPRIGYLVIPELAIYGTGGFAYGQINTSISEDKLFTAASNGKASDIAVGWSIGAGAEYKLTSDLSIRGEYLFVNLTANGISMPFAGIKTTQNVEFNVHLAKLGIIYSW